MPLLDSQGQRPVGTPVGFAVQWSIRPSLVKSNMGDSEVDSTFAKVTRIRMTASHFMSSSKGPNQTPPCLTPREWSKGANARSSCLWLWVRCAGPVRTTKERPMVLARSGAGAPECAGSASASHSLSTDWVQRSDISSKSSVSTAEASSASSS